MPRPAPVPATPRRGRRANRGACSNSRASTTVLRAAPVDVLVRVANHSSNDPDPDPDSSAARSLAAAPTRATRVASTCPANRFTATTAASTSDTDDTPNPTDKPGRDAKHASTHPVTDTNIPTDTDAATVTTPSPSSNNASNVCSDRSQRL